MELTQVSEAVAASPENLERARILAEMAQYSTMEAAAITNGLIVTRQIKDIEEAYALFEEVRKYAMAKLWDRTTQPLPGTED